MRSTPPGSAGSGRSTTLSPSIRTFLNHATAPSTAATTAADGVGRDIRNRTMPTLSLPLREGCS